MLLCAALVASAPQARADLDGSMPALEAQWAEMLERYTREVDDTAGTRVDYAALGSEPEWDELVRRLRWARPRELDTPELKIAFWINAYNILAIHTVVRNYPVESIKDVGTLLWPVWKLEAARIDGVPITLHEIEHDILRPTGEPRIHAAIVCASTSCPSLMRTPFTAARLDEQLDAATRRWLSDDRKSLRVNTEKQRILLSKIFRWFESDFQVRGGVIPFALPYLPEEQRQWIRENRRDATITHFDYDWSLNDTATAP